VVLVNMKYADRTTAKGKEYWYYRRNGRRHGRLQGKKGSRQWLADYYRIDATFSGQVFCDIPNSFKDVVKRYMASPDYVDLRDSSKRIYKTYLNQLVDIFGETDIAAIRRVHVRAYRDKISYKRGAANASVLVIKVVMAWAQNADLIVVNPAIGIKPLKMGSHKAWPEPLIEHFIAHAPVDVARVVAFALYTAQRKGDVLKARWTDIEDGGINFTQQKTGKHIWIPIHPHLQEVLDATPKRGVMILTTKTGRPWTASNFKHAFGRICKRLGIKGYVFHGLRKSAASRLAEAGCSTEQIKAMTGHESDHMAAYYAKGAEQKKLAKAALKKLIS